MEFQGAGIVVVRKLVILFLIILFALYADFQSWTRKLVKLKKQLILINSVLLSPNSMLVYLFFKNLHLESSNRMLGTLMQI